MSLKESKMQTLTAFGCSFTYGHGLADCVKPDGKPGQQPSQKAWPAVLADLIGMHIYNNSAPGASNLEILHRLLKCKFYSTDTVVIMWSFIERDYIFKNQQDRITGTQIGHWVSDDVAKNWMLTHDLNDMGIRSWHYIQHADLYVKSRGAKCFHFVMKPSEYIKFKPDYIDIEINPVVNGYMMLEIDRAPDGHHPGPLAHEFIAKRMETLINGNS
jgi:hypothetical protein